MLELPKRREMFGGKRPTERDSLTFLPDYRRLAECSPCEEEQQRDQFSVRSRSLQLRPGVFQYSGGVRRSRAMRSCG